MSLYLEQFRRQVTEQPDQAGILLLQMVRDNTGEVAVIGQSRQYAGEELEEGVTRLQRVLADIPRPTNEQIAQARAFLGISPESTQPEADLTIMLRRVQESSELASQIGKPTDQMYGVIGRMIAGLSLGSFMAAGGNALLRRDQLYQGLSRTYQGLNVLNQQPARQPVRA